MSIFDTQSVLANFMKNISAKGMKENYQQRTNPNYFEDLFGVDDDGDDSNTSNIDAAIIENEANAEENGGFLGDIMEGLEDKGLINNYDEDENSVKNQLNRIYNYGWFLPNQGILSIINSLSTEVGGPTYGDVVTRINDLSGDFFGGYGRFLQENYSDEIDPILENINEGVEGIQDFGSGVYNKAKPYAQDLYETAKNIDKEDIYDFGTDAGKFLFDNSALGMANKGYNSFKSLKSKYEEALENENK